MPSPLSYVTLVSTALSCQRIKSSQAERSDTLCVPLLQIVPDGRSTNMIASCTGDVGRLRGGHQQDPVWHSRELDHTIAQGTSMRIKLMTICVILHKSFMQLQMFVSITFLSLTFVVANSLYIHGLLCVFYKADQIGKLWSTTSLWQKRHLCPQRVLPPPSPSGRRCKQRRLCVGSCSHLFNSTSKWFLPGVSL